MLTTGERRVFARLGELLHAFDSHITYQFRYMDPYENSVPGAEISPYPTFASHLPALLICASPLTEEQALGIFNTLNVWKIRDVGVSFCIKNEPRSLSPLTNLIKEDYYPFFCVSGVFYSGWWPWSFRSWIQTKYRDGTSFPMVEYLKIDNLRWLFSEKEDVQGILKVFPSLKELEYIFDPAQEDLYYPVGAEDPMDPMTKVKMDHEVVEKILGEKARPREL